MTKTNRRATPSRCVREASQQESLLSIPDHSLRATPLLLKMICNITPQHSPDTRVSIKQKISARLWLVLRLTWASRSVTMSEDACMPRFLQALSMLPSSTRIHHSNDGAPKPSSLDFIHDPWVLSERVRHVMVPGYFWGASSSGTAHSRKASAMHSKDF